MRIANRTVATIDYKLTDESGEVLDSSEEDGPLAYLHGFGNIVPGLEKALDGKVAGDALNVRVAPADAYGERDDSLIEAVPRDRFPRGEIEVGMRFQAQSKAGIRMLTVVAVSDTHVTVDANHPLAGQVLNFDVTVREVRAATEEEVEHGHVHDGHGHHHHDHDHGDDHDHDHGDDGGHHHH